MVDDWAPLYAGLVQAWGGIAQMGFESQEIAGQKIMENMTKAFELHDPNLPYIATWWTNIDVLIDNPGFIEIVDKMNLSLADR